MKSTKNGGDNMNGKDGYNVALLLSVTLIFGVFGIHVVSVECMTITFVMLVLLHVCYNYLVREKYGREKSETKNEEQYIVSLAVVLISLFIRQSQNWLTTYAEIYVHDNQYMYLGYLFCVIVFYVFAYVFVAIEYHLYLWCPLSILNIMHPEISTYIFGGGVLLGLIDYCIMVVLNCTRRFK